MSSEHNNIKLSPELKPDPDTESQPDPDDESQPEPDNESRPEPDDVLQESTPGTHTDMN